MSPLSPFCPLSKGRSGHLVPADRAARSTLVDQTCFVFLRGPVVLSFGGSDPLLIFEPVLVAEDPEIDIATIDFCEVDIIRPPVARRQLLEEKDLGDETSQDCIAEKEGLEVRTNFGEIPSGRC